MRFLRVALMAVVVCWCVTRPGTALALEGGLSLQPGLGLIENESVSQNVRTYLFAGAIDADFKIIAGLFADANLMYYITEITQTPKGNIQGIYGAAGAKYKFKIGESLFPFLLAGAGPHYHRVFQQQGSVKTTTTKTYFGMTVGAGIEYFFSQRFGVDFTIKQYFTFTPDEMLKILTLAPGIKVRF